MVSFKIHSSFVNLKSELSKLASLFILSSLTGFNVPQSKIPNVLQEQLLRVSEVEDPESGDTLIVYTLVDCSTPFHHGMFHTPDTSKIIAQTIGRKMMDEVGKNPLLPVGNFSKFILVNFSSFQLCLRSHKGQNS